MTTPLTPSDVNNLHRNDDLDHGDLAHHHTLGIRDNQAAKGSHKHTYIIQGTGSPETVVASPVGVLYLRSDGGSGTTLYVKESGTGKTGWIGK